jgi:hypothetical protein
VPGVCAALSLAKSHPLYVCTHGHGAVLTPSLQKPWITNDALLPVTMAGIFRGSVTSVPVHASKLALLMQSLLHLVEPLFLGRRRFKVISVRASSMPHASELHEADVCATRPCLVHLRSHLLTIVCVRKYLQVETPSFGSRGDEDEEEESHRLVQGTRRIENGPQARAPSLTGSELTSSHPLLQR